MSCIWRYSREISFGFTELLPEHYVQWCKERDKRRIGGKLYLNVNLDDN